MEKSTTKKTVKAKPKTTTNKTTTNKTTKAVKPVIKSGGRREGSGRKTNESLGLETKEVTSVSLYPSKKQKLVKQFGSLTSALESL